MADNDTTGRSRVIANRQRSTGYEFDMAEWDRSEAIELAGNSCSRCGGAGLPAPDPLCLVCHGNGRVAATEPITMTTFKREDGDPWMGEYTFMSYLDGLEDAWEEASKPINVIEERWVLAEAIVHTKFPTLYTCEYEDQEPCEEDAVCWQTEGEDADGPIWMQACERHQRKES